MLKTIPLSVITAARQGYTAWNVPASVTLAQWADESNFGQDMPIGSNNPFGIKAVAGQPSVTVQTKEQNHLTGEIYTINAAFRKFNSIADAFDAHAKLLATGRPYAGITQYLNQPLVYIQKMAPIYASSLIYAQVLTELVNEYNLTQYDIKISASPIQPPQAIAAVVVGAAVTTAVAVKAPHIVHVSLGGSLALIVGILIGVLVTLLLAIIVYLIDRSRSSVVGTVEPLNLSTDKETEMAVRVAMEPVIAAITAQTTAASGAEATAAELVTANAALAVANATIAQMTKNDTDTDAAVAAAAGQPAPAESVDPTVTAAAADPTAAPV